MTLKEGVCCSGGGEEGFRVPWEGGHRKRACGARSRKTCPRRRLQGWQSARFLLWGGLAAGIGLILTAKIGRVLPSQTRGLFSTCLKRLDVLSDPTRCILSSSLCKGESSGAERANRVLGGGRKIKFCRKGKSAPGRPNQNLNPR